MVVQEIAREALVIRYLHSRKVKRQLERNATEMGAARLTGTLPYHTVTCTVTCTATCTATCTVTRTLPLVFFHHSLPDRYPAIPCFHHHMVHCLIPPPVMTR